MLPLSVRMRWPGVALMLLSLLMHDSNVQMVLAQQQELQSQVIALQGGKQAVISDEFGLMLPPHPEAVAWLKDFWATGKPKQRSRVTGPAASDQSSWLQRMMPQTQGKGSLCGNPNGPNGPKTNVLIVPAGDEWTADKWLDRPEAASFDIIAIYHGDSEEFACPRCAAVVRIKGPKWRLYLDLGSGPEWSGIAERYEYLMLPDDDLKMTTCQINKVFEIMATYDLILGQPSVCDHGGSATWRPDLHQRVQFLLRYSTFVEVMAPTYRMDFFHNVVRHTFSKYWTYVGWGLDSVWPALLHYPRNRIAIIDAVCITHTPTEGGLGKVGKANSVYRPGLSPYTAKQEELIVFSAYNYSASTTEAMGEQFMSLHILGGVLNDEVSAALARTAGEAPALVADCKSAIGGSGEYSISAFIAGALVAAVAMTAAKRVQTTRRRKDRDGLPTSASAKRIDVLEARKLKDPSCEA